MTTSFLQAVMMTTFSNFIALYSLLGMVIIVSSFKLNERKDTESLTPGGTWVPLCDEGHRYLFSEDLVNGGPDLADWANAEVKCGYLGGYLVRIENRHENNCILVHAQNQGLHHYWWTSGLKKIYIIYFLQMNPKLNKLSYQFQAMIKKLRDIMYLKMAQKWNGCHFGSITKELVLMAL